MQLQCPLNPMQLQCNKAWERISKAWERISKAWERNKIKSFPCPPGPSVAFSVPIIRNKLQITTHKDEQILLNHFTTIHLHRISYSPLQDPTKLP